MGEERPPTQFRVGKDRELHSIADADVDAKEPLTHGRPLTSKPAGDVTRHVTGRDGRIEGEPVAEGESPAKARQRDVTSLSTPVPDDDKA